MIFLMHFLCFIFISFLGGLWVSYKGIQVILRSVSYAQPCSTHQHEKTQPLLWFRFTAPCFVITLSFLAVPAHPGPLSSAGVSLVPVLAALVVDNISTKIAFSMLVIPVSRSTVCSASDTIGSGSGSALHPAVLSVAVFATAVSTFVSATSIFMHLKNYRRPMLQR
jgi:hypothetical protein